MDTNDSEKVSYFVALRTCTLRLTFVIVIGLGLVVSALVVCLDVYGNKELQQSQGDVIINQISNSYCRGVEITAADNQSYFNAYVMPEEPVISPKKLSYINGKQFYMPSWTYQYWGVYLLEGSFIHIHVCADQYIMFYIIKGLKSFHEWKQTTLYRGYSQKHRLFPKNNCKDRSQYDHFRVVAKNTDNFFFLFSSSVGWRFYTKVFVVLEVERSVYNTSNAVHTCSSQDFNATCHLQLGYDSKHTVVIEHTSKSGKLPDSFEQSRIIWKPEPRFGYYAKFFGGIFLCVVLLTLVYSVSRCIMRSYKKPSKYPPLMESKSRDKQQIRKVTLPRRETRTTLTSYEVINQNDIEEEEACERRLSRLNEEFNASTTYTSNDQVRDLNMTAAGISAI